MSKASDSTPPRERILDTASGLFANQGYRATGINEVIDRSGVAKATFYSHFRTKDDLCLAYLQQRNVLELEAIRNYVARKRTPRGRLLAVMESIEPWLVANSLRGCGFLNMVAEEPDPESPLRREGMKHYCELQHYIGELAQALIASDKAKYGRLDAKTLASDYVVILTGSIALVEIHHDTWPIRHGIQLVSRLVDTPG